MKTPKPSKTRLTDEQKELRRAAAKAGRDALAHQRSSASYADAARHALDPRHHLLHMRQKHDAAVLNARRAVRLAMAAHPDFWTEEEMTGANPAAPRTWRVAFSDGTSVMVHRAAGELGGCPYEVGRVQTDARTGATRTVTAVEDRAATAKSLAREFSRVLRLWLTPEQMAEVVRRNATEEYEKCCATGDFIDSNEAMAAAFNELGVPTCLAHEDGTPAHEAACELWSEAWDLAKAAEFDPEHVR